MDLINIFVERISFV